MHHPLGKAAQGGAAVAGKGEQFVGVEFADWNNLDTAGCFGGFGERGFDRAEGVALDDGVGEEAVRQGVEVVRGEAASHEITVARRRPLHSVDAEFVRRADDLIGNGISHAGVQGRFNNRNTRCFQNTGCLITIDTPPIGGLRDGVAEEFSGQALEVWFGETALDEIKFTALNAGEAIEAQCARIGKQTSIARIDSVADNEGVNLSRHLATIIAGCPN